MKNATLSRRLLAGVAGLTIGLSGVLVLAAPAQAEEVETLKQDAIEVTQPTCDDERGYIEIPYHKGILIKYKLDGRSVSPGTQELEVGEYVVTKKVKSFRTWRTVKTWPIEVNPATDCDDEDENDKRKRGVKDPTKTHPTCEDPQGYIHIPEVDRLHLVDYKIDGVKYERGETVAVEPGDYKVTAHGKKFGKKWKKWIFHFEEPEDCPGDETPTPGPTEPPADEEEENGEGGGEELPVTGSQTLLVAGAALLLLTMGGGLYMLARRRRISFTV